jgi:hypothetical protein
MSTQPDFKKASETREQKQARLEAQAKALDDSLRKSQLPQPRLTPNGTLKRDGQDLARDAMNAKRVDIAKELESIKADLKERDKSQEKERGRSL